MGAPYEHPPTVDLLLQLLHRALGRLLVVAPALDLRAVADAVVGDVVEGHFDDELGAQADPFEVAAGRPARGAAGAALAGLVGRQASRQLALLLGAEAAGVADLAQPAVGLVEPQDDRAERPVGLARPPAQDDGVDRPHALDLDHAGALTGPVRGFGLHGDDALLGRQPAACVLRGPDDRRQLDAGQRGLLERLAPLAVGQL